MDDWREKKKSAKFQHRFAIKVKVLKPIGNWMLAN